MGEVAVTGREVHLAERPQGEPRPEDFRIVEVEVTVPAEGELLVRNTWMSLDPSMRIRMHESDSSYLPMFQLDRPLEGWAVGEVTASRADGFAVGDTVLHQHGWREYALLSAEAAGRGAPTRVDVDDSTPARAYLGPLGWVGLTSYVGLLDVAELREGDVVFVSAAAGAVGSLVVQIAKIRGHVVIASAGSAEKAAFVRDELGADVAFSYRDGSVRDSLRAAAPGGIDVYFDNVGGDHLQAALDALRVGGRVAMCGAISTYNAMSPVPGPSNLFETVARSLTIRGFLARRYGHRLPEFRRDMRSWLADGRIVYPETIVEGIESAPDALIGLLRGENIGKMLVQLS